MLGFDQSIVRRDLVRGRWNVFLRYLVASLAGHFVWEVLQLPFYTLWKTGTVGQQALAVVHCTLGDGVIAGLSLVLAVVVAGRAGWPRTTVTRVFLVSLVLGIGYTIVSEWLNVVVRGSWAYAELMPVVLVLGTGLTPLLQWLVVPIVAQWFAVGWGAMPR